MKLSYITLRIKSKGKRTFFYGGSISNKPDEVHINNDKLNKVSNFYQFNTTDNEIKLVIDLHGADKNRDFDVEFGTLNNLSADFSTIKELEDAFVSRGIINIVHNDPFKGGAITQYLFNVKDLDVIQLEINGRFRSIEHIDNLELLCNALMDFINRYIESIIREKE
jgi:hypothetical protein